MIKNQFIMSKALNIKKRGNKLFEIGSYNKAIEEYSKIFKKNLKKEKIFMDILCNRSLAYLKIKEYHKSIKDSFEVLKINPLHLKALYRLV